MAGVYDIDGNLVGSNSCTQTLVSGQTKVIAFQVSDAEPSTVAGVSGSMSRLATAPNGRAPHLTATFKIKHNGKVRNDRTEIPGQRKGKDSQPSNGNANGRV